MTKENSKGSEREKKVKEGQQLKRSEVTVKDGERS